MNKHIRIIIGQVIFLVVALVVIYMLYPKINIDLDGTKVRFNPINANVVILSENPDFSNPRYIELDKDKGVWFALKPGTYYWKAENDFIESLKKKFVIDSEVGMKINRDNDEAELENVGNVKVNISKNSDGVMVGHIILEPEESEEIEDIGEYVGRQDE